MPPVEELRETAVAYNVGIKSIDETNGEIVVPEGYGAALQEMITQEYPESNITKYEIKTKGKETVAEGQGRREGALDYVSYVIDENGNDLGDGALDKKNAILVG